jgi:amino acid transporter, AAT family
MYENDTVLPMKSEPLTIMQREAGLAPRLTRAQIVMIGLGSAIGTGLFAGSSMAIGYAGPAVVISYLIAGIAAAAIVLSLSEMAVAHPGAGSFGLYAELYLNSWAGFVVRYTYWMAQIIAIGGEATAAGLYMRFWFPFVPVWLWATAFACVIGLVNASSVKNFASIEFFLTLIKVCAIIFFIVIGFGMIAGIATPPVGLHNVHGLAGGFMPMGISGVWMAVVVGIFSFTGVEIVAVTSGEAANPTRTIPAAMRSMAVRLLLFYVLTLFVIVAIAPWTETGTGNAVVSSPFVRVFQHTGIAYAAGIMNFVVLSAALSSMNTNVYLCSRMLFSLARGGYAPEHFGRLSNADTPLTAIMVSSGFVLAATALSIFTPLAYSYLFGVALFGAITVWIIILLSHFGFRHAHGRTPLTLRAPFFPMAQILGLALLIAVLVTMAFGGPVWRVSWFVGIPWLALLSAVFARMRYRRTTQCQ